MQKVPVWCVFLLVLQSDANKLKQLIRQNAACSKLRDRRRQRAICIQIARRRAYPVVRQ
jgi:hypothetical protein